MNSGLRFLVAARLCEISELEHLQLMGELVTVVCRLVHALQKERGLSNLYLASGGAQSGEALHLQVGLGEKAQRELLDRLDHMDTDAGRERHSARLFSRIAVVLHAMESLPALRLRVEQRALGAGEASAFYTRLIQGLLGVVFEAADSATDPEISRALVAFFHFMQGKEYAGQERALGAAAFASGQITAPQQSQWQQLIEAQDACLQVYADFSEAAMREAWRLAQPSDAAPVLERLRRLAASAAALQGLDTPSSQIWYGCCTERIDAMKRMEDQLALNLRLLCERRIAQARLLLHDQQAIVNALQQQAHAAGSDAPALLGPQLERSVLSLVQEQSRRLQAVSDELETARAALNERKVIERAKGLLMSNRKIDEDEAYKMLRQTAMNQGRRLVDVARTVITMSDYL